MSHDPSPIDDKLELHHRQQLSALVDGELAPDQARFLLRRLQHDPQLSGRFERWQLCGDVLRGQVRRAAAPELGARIAMAIAAEPTAMVISAPAAVQAQSAARRQAWMRWGGGGAALAASVAVLAMFAGRPAAIDPSLQAPSSMAVQTLPSSEAMLAEAAPVAVELPGTVPSPRQAPVRPRSPPSRMVASTRPSPLQATAPAQIVPTDGVADAGTQLAAETMLDDPFASTAPLQARPWPRAVLARPAGSAYTARLGEPSAGASFYPFELRLPAQARLPHAPAEGEARPMLPEQQDLQH